MIKRVWITRTTVDKGGYYRLWVSEPQWDEMQDNWFTLTMYQDSMSVCPGSVERFLGVTDQRKIRAELKPGECIEVKTSPGQLWVAP